MANAQQRTTREVIEFTANATVTVALKFNQGRKIAGQHGERMMYTTPDDRIFFVSLEVAGQIEAAGINVRENFTITQEWDGVKGSPPTWEAPPPTHAPPTAPLSPPNP